MDLIDASMQGHPLIYTLPHSTIDAVAAHIFATPHGIIIADAGWGGDSFGYCSRHPFHRIQGRRQGTGPWRVGPVRIRQLATGDTAQALWDGYQAFLRTDWGRPQTRAACARVLQELEYLP